MISPETLRRYPFFGPFDDQQLKSIAMISEEGSAETGTIIFEECQPANAFYLLMEGSVDFSYKSEEEFHPKTSKEFSAGEVNPGEVFAFSSVIIPYVLNATAKATRPCRFIKIDAKALRELLEKDPKMGYTFMHQVASAIMERLAYTRIQLAAAWG